MLCQRLGYTDVKTKSMFIENKIAFYQVIGIDQCDTDEYKMKIWFCCYF